jgi:transposase
VKEINELRREGLSIREISRLTGYDRKTISRRLSSPTDAPVNGKRSARVSKLAAFRPYLNERLKAGVWDAQVLLRELRERNYAGGSTILTDWLRTQRKEAFAVAARSLETPPGKQAKVDWGRLGILSEEGRDYKLWGFTITMNYSRRMMAGAATDQKLGTLMWLHESAFEEWGGVPEKILYGRAGPVWSGTDESGEIVWNPVFVAFARYWGFTPQLRRPFSAQPRGEMDSGLKYVRRNFHRGLMGAHPASLAEFNAQLRRWVAEVANERVHSASRQKILSRWDEEKQLIQRVNQLPFPQRDNEQLKVAHTGAS